MYQSSKSGGTYLAVFVNRLAFGSFIELTGNSPVSAIARLDETLAEEQDGWTQLGIKHRRV